MGPDVLVEIAGSYRGRRPCVPDCASGMDTPVRTIILLEDPSAKGYFTKLVERRAGRSETFDYTPGHPPDNWTGGAS